MLNCKRSFEPSCLQQLYWKWSTCFLCFTPSTTVLPSPPTSTSSFSAAHVDAPIVQSRSVTTSPVLQPQLSQSDSLEMAVLIPIVLIIMSNKPAPHVSRFLPTRDIIVGPPLPQSIGQPPAIQRYPVQIRNPNALSRSRCTRTPISSFPTPNLIQPLITTIQLLIQLWQFSQP